MAGYIGNIPVPQGTQTRQNFTATASQTSFPTIGYTAGFIDVYLNGVKLINGTDFTATNGSDVVLASAASASDVLDVVIFDTFNTSSGTFSDTTLKNNVTLKNDTEEDSDGGRASKIIYKGEQSGGEISTLAEIQASHDGTADDQKGDLIFRTNDGADGTSPTEALRITSAQKIGLGNNDPSAKLDVSEVNNTSSLVSARYNSSNRKIGFNVNNSNGQGFLAFNSNSVSGSANQTYDTNGVAAKIDYAGDMTFDLAASGTAGNTITYSEKMRILAGGGITFNGDTAAANALDDYEEGTFVPTLEGTSATGTASYGGQYGRYVKIGSMVHWQLHVGLASLSSASGNIRIRNLPFTSRSTQGETVGAVMANFFNISNGDTVAYFMASSQTELRFYVITDNGGWVQQQISNQAQDFYLSGTYIAN